MHKHISITEIMTPDPITISPGDTMQTVHQIWQHYNFHHLPVVDAKHHLLGMISFNDYLTVTRNIYHTNYEVAIEKRYLESVLVKDVMTPPHKLVALDAGATLTDALRMFKANRFHAVPVVDRQKLVGIVTVYDMMAAMERLLEQQEA